MSRRDERSRWHDAARVLGVMSVGVAMTAATEAAKPSSEPHPGPPPRPLPQDELSWNPFGPPWGGRGKHAKSLGRIGRAMGGVAGCLAGAAAGSAGSGGFGAGPGCAVGGFIGGALGEWLGTDLGEWADQVDAEIDRLRQMLPPDTAGSER